MNFGKLDTASYFTGVTIFLALFLAVIEPASSVASSFWLRLLQWTLQVGIPLLTLIAVHIQLGKLASFEKLNPWARLTISGIIGSLVFSPIALALDFLFGIENLGTELDPGCLPVCQAEAIQPLYGFM
jgi:hypothetical protein